FVPEGLCSTLNGGRVVSFLHRKRLEFQGFEKAGKLTRHGRHKRKSRGIWCAPSSMLPPMTVLRISLACLLAVLLTACGRVEFEWQGPTDNFRALDANKDGDVDRFEWEQSHGAVFEASLGFRHADCDADGRMSWHEYFEGYMHLKHCPGRYLYEPPPPPPPADGSYGAVAYHADNGEPDNW